MRSEELLALHGVRLSGFCDVETVAARFGQDLDTVTEVLLDAQARGWVQHSEFAGLGGWSLTGRGRLEGEQLLAHELDTVGARELVQAVHQEFLPFNARLLRACTDWQLRTSEDGRLEPNDHRDPTHDGRVVQEFAELGLALTPLEGRLRERLARFAGYTDRYAAALDHTRAGDLRWFDAADVDSCHRVWFEFHEDLIATLGLTR